MSLLLLMVPTGLAGVVQGTQEHDVLPGTLLRIKMRFPPPDFVEGRYWRPQEEGLLVEVRGRPEVLAWGDLDSVQFWRTGESSRRTEGIFALIGALAVGAGYARWLGDDEGPGAGKGFLIGAPLGGGIGWVIGHQLSANRGRWEPVSIEALVGEPPILPLVPRKR